MPNRRYFVDVAASNHPVPTTAVGEVAGELMERDHLRPDVLFVFVTAPFAGILEDIAPALRRLVSPTVLAGCVADRIFGPEGWLTEDAAISVMAVNIGDVIARRYEPGVVPDSQPDSTTIVLADPHSTQISLLSTFSGGYAGAGPGRSSLVLDDQIYTDGCIAVAFPQTRHVITCSAPQSLSLPQWTAAAGLLAFSDAAALFWQDTIAGDPDVGHLAEEIPPHMSGFVSKITFPAPLTVFRGETGPEQET